MAKFLQRVTYRKDGVQSTRDVDAMTPAAAERKLRRELGEITVESVVTTVPPVA
jgi:hypothetical protein